jgi:hypothetical protein
MTMKLILTVIVTSLVFNIWNYFFMFKIWPCEKVLSVKYNRTVFPLVIAAEFIVLFCVFIFMSFYIAPGHMDDFDVQLSYGLIWIFSLVPALCILVYFLTKWYGDHPKELKK